MAVAADREEDRELVKNLGGDCDVRFGGFERESHLSLALRGTGREGGRKRERTSKSERDERRPQLVVGVGEPARKGKRGERERERGRNGLKNDTQLPLPPLLMFRLSASKAAPLDFFKPQTTTTATNCDQSRFSVGLGLLRLLWSGLACSMYPRGVGTGILRCNRWSRKGRGYTASRG